MNRSTLYNVSLYSFLTLILLGILAFPISQYAASFYQGWGGLGAFAFSGVVFIVLMYLSGLVSLISGIYAISRNQHVLIWVIPEGIIVIASILYLFYYVLVK